MSEKVNPNEKVYIIIRANGSVESDSHGKPHNFPSHEQAVNHCAINHIPVTYVIPVNKNCAFCGRHLTGTHLYCGKCGRFQD